MLNHPPSQNVEFDQYCERKKQRYGELFSTEDLAPQFIPYLHTNTRIKVEDKNGKIHFGSVGITTGWRPAFLLMHSERCIGSSCLLTKEDKIIAYKDGHKYVPLGTPS